MPSGSQGARGIGRSPDPIPVSDAVALVLLVALELVALWLVVRMWREHGRSVGAKVLWSVVTLVPVLGLVAWAAWHDRPPPNGPTDRPARRDWDAPG
jgi:uncharacterized membrane protein YhaH (DUF805 family)